MSQKDYSDVILPGFRYKQVPPLLRAFPCFPTTVRSNSKALSAAVKGSLPWATYSSSLQPHLLPPPLPAQSLSLPQPHAKNLQFFAISGSWHVLAQRVPSPTSFFSWTNEYFKGSLSLGTLPWKLQTGLCASYPLLLHTHSLDSTAMLSVGLLVSFLPHC